MCCSELTQATRNQEGDAESDCLLIDRNKDGIYAGPGDFSIDWCDENKDDFGSISTSTGT